MKKIQFFMPMLLLVGLMFIVMNSMASENESNDSKKIERGHYLVTLAGCGDCHSPKKMTEMGPIENPDLLYSGHPADEPPMELPKNLGEGGWIASCNAHLTAWAGPWGITYASNLSSDKKTGLGNWNDEQFIKAMRTGKHRGFGRPILPPMPWQNLAKASDEDLSAMLAFFKSTKPISNEVPAPILNKQ